VIFINDNLNYIILKPIYIFKIILFYVQILRWIDEQNLTEVIRPWYCEALPFPLNYYYPGKYEKDAKSFIEILYSTDEFQDIEYLVSIVLAVC
jgi:hypothetical protein